MKKVKIETLIKHKHRLTNDSVVNMLEEVKEGYIISKIDDCLVRRGLNQRDLSILTGIRIGTISEMVNGKEASFNKNRLIAVMVALRVSSMDELIEIRLPTNIVEQYEKESTEWIETREMPPKLKNTLRFNLLKNSGLED